MIRRLSISVMLLAMAAFALTGVATAFWSTSESAAVSIEAGTADLAVSVNANCDGQTVFTLDDDGVPGALPAWSGIYPGATTSDCFVVENTGDAPLDVTLRFQAFSGNNLLSALQFQYRANIGNGTIDPGAVSPNDPFWNNGVTVATLAPGDTEDFRVNARFENTTNNQNSLMNTSAGFTAVIEGVTP